MPWRSGSRNWRKIILQDKAVESLSSFIGVDGTNTTPNEGRIQINLKPRDERADDASAIIRRLQPELAKVDGITLYMQPVQDLTVEDRVSRTQFQYSIEDADAQELAQWTPKLVAKLQTLPALRDVATDQLNNGLKTNVTIDRDTASRLGIFPQAIDNTLYDAFGQRQVSTIFTQLNQYHVILEVLPNFAQTPEALKDIYIRPSTVTPNSGAPTANGAAVTTSGAPVPISTFTQHAVEQRFSCGQPSGAVPGGDALVQPGAGSIAGRRDQGDPAGGKRHPVAPQHSRGISGNGCGISEFAGVRALPDSGGRDHGLHRARRFV